MLFNSIDFAVFLPLVFLLYWFLAKDNRKFQNLLIVLSSFFFYGFWDWRFLNLLLASILIDYFVAILIEKTDVPSKRKVLLFTSLFFNLGLLGFFKYYNFFIDNFCEAFTFFGNPINKSSLQIILPVGISFYTFQTLSYTLDVYRRKINSTNDFIAFAAYVSFFPQLVAGPIERASNLLPQFFKNRTFDYSKAVDGLKQMLWGFIKKMVIADNCAVFANDIFNHSADYSGSTLLLGAVFFAFQIYGDFSGYSDIAIGCARLFGFDLMKNFNFPYFSRDIAEFWRRWHISLTTWFRDYVYVPLGGSRASTWTKIRNTLIVFLLSGFWHGANWTFIVWGALNALFFLPLLLSNKNRQNLGTVAEGKKFPSFKEFTGMLTTFLLVLVGWIFFRAENISHAIEIFSEIFSSSILYIPELPRKVFLLAPLISILLVIEWIGRNNPYPIYETAKRWHWFFRWTFYAVLIFILGMYMHTSETPFIYFQF
ncbi:MAG: acyltransferase [Bacteroidetes bacterium RIFCSPLOWO2_02_FULL_36_8]|nr:MAG: acyltransferase [Bacteroidetes bacterium RIFCSPLOWO2_02_FULL_36_8]OFY68952.1 MAG: acyltransferase [Bacteroidetes bacterium RIFCSPLOWO2_12_FULL_37_12]